MDLNRQLYCLNQQKIGKDYKIIQKNRKGQQIRDSDNPKK